MEQKVPNTASWRCRGGGAWALHHKDKKNDTQDWKGPPVVAALLNCTYQRQRRCHATIHAGKGETWSMHGCGKGSFAMYGNDDSSVAGCFTARGLKMQREKEGKLQVFQIPETRVRHKGQVLCACQPRMVRLLTRCSENFFSPKELRIYMVHNQRNAHHSLFAPICSKNKRLRNHF